MSHEQEGKTVTLDLSVLGSQKLTKLYILEPCILKHAQNIGMVGTLFRRRDAHTLNAVR